MQYENAGHIVLIRCNKIISSDKRKTDDIISFKTSKITFESDEPIPWTLDGEFGGEVTTAHIENLPRAFSVIV